MGRACINKLKLAAQLFNSILKYSDHIYNATILARTVTIAV